MTVKQKKTLHAMWDKFKPFFGPVTTIITGITLFSTLTGSIYSAVHNEVMLINTNTTMATQTKLDLAVYKTENNKAVEDVKIIVKSQGDKIESQGLDIEKLLTINSMR